MNNDLRECRAHLALLPYNDEDTITNIIDLLADLLHLCHREDIDFDECRYMAYAHFEHETDKEE